MHDIVIIGGGYAGLLTALRLQTQQQAHVTLINNRETFVKRIRLHQVATGQRIPTLNLRDFLAKTPITFRQATVREILPDEKCIRLDDATLRYDTLVIATGSHVDRDTVPGIREHAYTLDAASAEQLRSTITSDKRLLVVGGGLTGIEAAAEFADKLNVALVTRGKLGSAMSERGANHLRSSLTRKGVTLHETSNVRAIHRDHLETNAGRLDFDLCLWAGGFRANPLPADAGFTVNAAGQLLLCDTLQAVDHEDVFAVGDAGTITMQSGNALRMACATAMPMGTHAADNISRRLQDEPLQPFDFGYTVQCTSLGRGNALAQFVTDADAPTARVLTGLVGHLAKEGIGFYTVASLYLEKWFPGSYRYPQGVRAITPEHEKRRQPA